MLPLLAAAPLGKRRRAAGWYASTEPSSHKAAHRRVFKLVAVAALLLLELWTNTLYSAAWKVKKIQLMWKLKLNSSRPRPCWCCFPPPSKRKEKRKKPGVQIVIFLLEHNHNHNNNNNKGWIYFSVFTCWERKKKITIVWICAEHWNIIVRRITKLKNGSYIYNNNKVPSLYEFQHGSDFNLYLVIYAAYNARRPVYCCCVCVNVLLFQRCRYPVDV